MDELNPVQNVRLLEDYKSIRADFERMARLGNHPLKPEELDQMAMAEAGERFGRSSAGESPEALRSIKPANAAQAQRLQRLLHTRTADLAGQEQEDSAPAEAPNWLDLLTRGSGTPESRQQLEQFGERGAQNIAGLVGGISRTVGAGNTALDAEEFEAANTPSAVGGNRLAQTAGDVAGGYSGTYPLALGIEGGLAKTPVLGPALKSVGSRLGKLAGAGEEVLPRLLRGGLQALPKEVATGETFQGLVGGPGSLTTPGGQANALLMAGIGTGMRGLQSVDRGNVVSPQSRAEKLISDLRGGESGRALSPEETAARNAAKFGRVGGETVGENPLNEPTATRRAREAGQRAAPINPETINVNAPFEEGALPQQLPTGQYQPQSLEDALAGLYNQPEAAAVAKGVAPEEGAGFRALEQARARRPGINVGTPEDLTRSLNTASSKARRGGKGRAAGRYRGNEDTGGQPE